MNIRANGFLFLRFLPEFLTAVQSSYPLKSKYTLNTVCGLQISYPHSFSAVRDLNTAGSNHFMFGVRFARVKSAGCEPVPGFSFILITLR